MRQLWQGVVLTGLAVVLVCANGVQAQERLRYRDLKPQKYHLTARASEVDNRTKEHPEIGFVFQDGDGKVQDLQHAVVNTKVRPRGELVIWLMGYNSQLFDRLSDYGFHAIQVHYANKWFGTIKPTDEMSRGNVRLEAATGEDFSDLVNIPKPDGMMERSLQLVKWLAKENPQGGWEYYLTPNRQDLRWDRVVVAGSSHGSTTAARFAIHQRVGRVVMFCGPRDQDQNWQSLSSATPSNCYFGFSHVLDGGWTGDHYCRSWEMLGLHEHGPIVNVDQVKAPFGNSRRLITDFDVNKNANRAHSGVVPGNSAAKDASGKYSHEAVWKYLFTHPVNRTGEATPIDPDCKKQH